MKRLIALFSALSLLLSLSACGNNTVEPTTPPAETESVTLSPTPAVEEPAPSANPEVTPSLTYTDPAESFIPYEDDSSLLVYSGNALDELDWFSIDLYENQLLITSSEYDMEADQSTSTLLLFDPATDAATARLEQTTDGFMQIQVCGDQLVQCDSSSGLIQFWDSELLTQQKIQLLGDYMSWYLSSDGSGLYRCREDGTLTYTDFSTGTTSTVYQALSIYGISESNDGVNLTALNAESEQYQELWLNLETGDLQEAPFGFLYSMVSQSDGLWLAPFYGRSGVYGFGTEDTPFVMTVPDEVSPSLTDGGQTLLLTDYSDMSLYLYDSEGLFLSSCTLPQNSWLEGAPAWSEKFQGYFFIVGLDDGTAQIFLWLPDETRSGENLDTVPLSEYQAQEYAPAGTAANPALYERARALGEEYGLEILIADQCETDYDDFTVDQVSADYWITLGLDELEEALAQYPEGFFEQLKYGYIEKVQIILAGNLTSTNPDWGSSTYSAFTQDIGSVYIMVMDLYSLVIDNYYHEFSHIIDSKLEWDSYCRGDDALFSELGWAAYNPEGFGYEYTYSTFEQLDNPEAYWSSFIDTYAMVSPTEDRARVMEYAMSGYTWPFESGSNLAGKLDYYSRCIRDAFNTDGWPEVTLWEAALP